MRQILGKFVLDYTLIRLYGSSSIYCTCDIRTDFVDLPTE